VDGAGADAVLLGAQVERRVVRRARHLAAGRARRGRRRPGEPCWPAGRDSRCCRRVIANIERVAGLFVTKTVYAAIIAVAVGAAGITYPFFPRHLTIISTLTIGVPGFFLALAPGAPLARPGFTRRVLAFTIPAGTAAAAAGLAAYAIARAPPGVSATAARTAARTAAMLAVFAVGLWVLALAAGPPAVRRIALVVTMAGVLVLLFAVPLARRIFALALGGEGPSDRGAGLSAASRPPERNRDPLDRSGPGRDRACC